MGIQPASDELGHEMQKLFGELFAMEKISEGSPMLRDLEDFLGGAETEEGLGSLMEKSMNRCHCPTSSQHDMEVRRLDYWRRLQFSAE